MVIGQKVKQTAIMRITGAVRERLEPLMFSRYPNKEWAAYFLFGTHETPAGMVITAIGLIEPKGDDLDSTTSPVRFAESRTLCCPSEKLVSYGKKSPVAAAPSGRWPRGGQNKHCVCAE